MWNGRQFSIAYRARHGHRSTSELRMQHGDQVCRQIQASHYGDRLELPLRRDVPTRMTSELYKMPNPPQPTKAARLTAAADRGKTLTVKICPEVWVPSTAPKPPAVTLVSAAKAATLGKTARANAVTLTSAAKAAAATPVPSRAVYRGARLEPSVREWTPPPGSSTRLATATP